MPVVKAKKVVDSNPKKAKKENKPERPVVYDEISANVCIGDTAITVDDAKELLGWQEETDQEKFGSNYLLQDSRGRKIRCTNNIANRPINQANLLTLKQEHLRRRWRFNGEPIIVGKSALLANGQHTLISLILAAQEWEDDREKWGEYWGTEPTMEKLIISGVEEDDATINTMDTCKPRSLWEVIYRSVYFSSLSSKDRRNCARAADYAVRLLWHRTGAELDAFAPRRTHAESLDFIARHSRILECVKHVYEEDGKERKIDRYTSPGYAAGLMYLMGSSTTDPKEYHEAERPNEDLLDWANWDKASTFIVLLASGGDETKALRAELAKLIETGGGSPPERWALLCNAWLAYSEKEPITAASLQLLHTVAADGSKTLAEHPTVGGIDLGDPSKADEETIAGKDPSPDEIKDRAKKVRAKASILPAIGSKAGEEWAAKDKAWVYSQDGEHYFGTLLEDPYECDNGSWMVMLQDRSGSEWEVSLDDLRLNKPEEKSRTPASPKFAKAKGSGLPKVGTLLWVSEGKEPWRGRLVEVNTQLKVAKLKIETGFKGAGNVATAPLKALTVDQPVIA